VSADPLRGAVGPPFGVRLVREGGAERVIVTGEVDLVTGPMLDEQVHGASAEHVVLDLTGVTFIDSVGVRVVCDAFELLGDRLAVVASDCCMFLFELAGLRDRLPLLER